MTNLYSWLAAAFTGKLSSYSSASMLLSVLQLCQQGRRAVGRREGARGCEGARVRGHEGTVGFQDCGIDNLIRALSFKYLKLPKL